MISSRTIMPPSPLIIFSTSFFSLSFFLFPPHSLHFLFIPGSKRPQSRQWILFWTVGSGRDRKQSSAPAGLQGTSYSNLESEFIKYSSPPPHTHTPYPSLFLSFVHLIMQHPQLSLTRLYIYFLQPGDEEKEPETKSVGLRLVMVYEKKKRCVERKRTPFFQIVVIHLLDPPPPFFFFKQSLFNFTFSFLNSSLVKSKESTSSVFPTPKARNTPEQQQQQQQEQQQQQSSSPTNDVAANPVPTPPRKSLFPALEEMQDRLRSSYKSEREKMQAAEKERADASSGVKAVKSWLHSLAHNKTHREGVYMCVK